MPAPTSISARAGILAGGNWIVDRVKMVDQWPAQDTLATILSVQEDNGGGPYNVLKNLARLGAGFPLAGVGLLGSDADGQRIRQDCDAVGIDHAALLETSEASTSFTDVVTARDSGRRTFFHQPGANAFLQESHFKLTHSRAKIFYLGYLGLLPKLDAPDSRKIIPAARLFETARALGMVTVADLVSTDAERIGPAVQACLPYLDYLFLNELELARLVDQPPVNSVAALQEQAREVLHVGVSSAVIVHTPEFAICLRPGREVLVQPSLQLPANWIVGSAGAGDAFAAGVIFGLHEGWQMERALMLGACGAAMSLRDVTCSGAVVSWQECLQLGDRFGYDAQNDRL